MASARILLVCSDQQVAHATTRQLADREFAPAIASCTAEACEKMSSQIYDAIMLSQGATGDMDVQEAIALLRRHGYRGPIIVIHAKVSVSEEVLFFESGANDVISASESFPVLAARLKAHLRQFADNLDMAVQIGEVVFRPDIRALIASDGSRTKLTEKEVRLLQRLNQADGAAVSRRLLLEEIWGDANTRSHTLETHIYRLRQKLGRRNSPAVILTVDRGYRLIRC